MTKRVRDWLIIGCIAAVIFAAGFITKGLVAWNTVTTIVGKTLEYNNPGYTDETQKELPAQKTTLPKKDSAEYYKRKNDSLQAIISGRDTTVSADSVRAEYINPYKITVEDSLTINEVMIYPLEPMAKRARLLSTYYKPVKISIPYMDTTVNVTRGNDLKTYGVVAAGAAIGAAAGDEIGAAIGASAALLFDWIFF